MLKQDSHLDRIAGEGKGDTTLYEAQISRLHNFDFCFIFAKFFEFFCFPATVYRSNSKQQEIFVGNP